MAIPTYSFNDFVNLGLLTQYTHSNNKVNSLIGNRFETQDGFLLQPTLGLSLTRQLYLELYAYDQMWVSHDQRKGIRVHDDIGETVTYGLGLSWSVF